MKKKTCQAQNVPFFFKQWGAWGPDGVKRSKKVNGRVLQERVWEEYPEEAVQALAGG
jgi:protein gp37